MKANHNPFRTLVLLYFVVYQVKDTIFWKQITTTSYASILRKLLFIKSKIQFFESKSQRFRVFTNLLHSCLSSQRYNFLKANHNSRSQLLYNSVVVYQVKDTIFWKQITTVARVTYVWGPLFIKSKIQFFESKSQQSGRRTFRTGRCLSSQRYNFLKANHN